jgi:apolipoprotein N-acyltransferase
MTLGGLSFAGRCAIVLKDSQGVTRLGFAMGLGAMAALALEPLRIFPFMLLAYAGFTLLLDGAAASAHRYRNAAIAGWGFGFGFFVIGLYWIGYAFLVDPEAHAWQMPFAVIGLPAGLAFFFAIGAMLCMVYWPDGVRRIFVFAVAFFATEWLRGHILTGFPWNLPAYGWGASPAILQSASLFGAYGLSLLTLLFGASFAALAPYGRVSRHARFAPAGCAILFLVLWGGGEMRLASASMATVDGVHLRIVQPDTPQTEKYRQDLLVRNWRRLIDLSNAPGAVMPTHIVWPEAAPPFALTQVPSAMTEIAALTDDNRVLLTGDQRVEGTRGNARFYNSFDVIGPHGAMLGVYDKFHLVPFGEYLPFPGVLRALGFTEIAANTGFSAGPGPRTLEVPGAPPVGPLICYEVIFPGAVTAEPRPGWLVNVTDDSWFGPNTGPMQHLLIARVRAIEEGLPIVRAANSGISAVIDPEGRVRASLALGLRGVIDSDLPVALPPTLFAQYGNVILLALVLLSVSAALWPARFRRA